MQYQRLSSLQTAKNAENQYSALCATAAASISFCNRFSFFLVEK